MVLLQSRTPPLLHLLLLLLLLLSEGGGAVAMATGARRMAITCQHEIPSGLIQDLWRRSTLLLHRLPAELNSSRRTRLLPRFCTRCPPRAIGWLEMRELVDVYQRSVFSREVVHRLLPLHYEEALHRLQHTLQHCVTSSKPSDHFKIIMKLERKIKKRSRDERALKAVREFTFILQWIHELAATAQHHHHLLLL